MDPPLDVGEQAGGSPPPVAHSRGEWRGDCIPPASRAAPTRASGASDTKLCRLVSRLRMMAWAIRLSLGERLLRLSTTVSVEWSAGFTSIAC